MATDFPLFTNQKANVRLILQKFVNKCLSRFNHWISREEHFCVCRGFYEALSKTPVSKSYLQLNYILPKLSYQLSRSCIKEQNKHFQIYCTHCYVKNTFILESLLTATKKT